MIRRSPELEAIARRFFNAVQSRDGSALRNLVAESDHLSFIGTAPDELWIGRQVRDGLEAHFREAPDFAAEELYTEAYECGDCGWAFYSRQMRVEGRSEPVAFRTSLVFALIDGRWQIVHRHASLPVSNSILHGAEHSAMNALMETARAEGAMDGATGIATVMFTDVSGSSVIAAAIGDRRWADRIESHFTLIRECVEQAGGKLVKSLGDGTMSSFPSAQSAMRAANLVQNRVNASKDEPRLQVRIGLHTGAVIASGDDFFGTVVNKAARVAGQAGPGETRVSDATRMMVGGAPEFTFSDPLTVPLRGLEGDHLLHLLDWRS